MLRHLILIVLILFCGCALDIEAPHPTIAENYATTPDHVKLYYRVVGSGPETVIAPNALYHGSSLDSLAVGRRIVTYDPRGRGRSDAVPLNKVSLDHLLVDFETVRKAVGAEEVAIIGWSGSGMEMFVYALRNPHRVSRLIQLAPVAPRFEPYAAMMMDDRERRTDKSARDALRQRKVGGEFDHDPAAYCREVEKVSNPPLFADPERLPVTPDVCQYENEHDENISKYFAKLFESIVGYDWRESLSKITIPRLVIHGEKDNIPLEGNREWVRGQPNARLLIIREAGHWPHYEQPAATLTAMSDFLENTWPVGAQSIA